MRERASRTGGGGVCPDTHWNTPMYTVTVRRMSHGVCARLRASRVRVSEHAQLLLLDDFTVVIFVTSAAN